ncbi:MAG: alpha-L-fucosidase [Opitutaceae bacterium]|jgi:alpha-L-fucosidase|nr:alpha-L-fucosidase [Opitutaceae bacterium]
MRHAQKIILPSMLALAAGAISAGDTGDTNATDGPPPLPRAEWFDEARFGMFVHWGIYSVAGNVWEGRDRSGPGIDRNAEWLMQRVPVATNEYYGKLAPGFTAANYDPRLWARLAREAGMRYIVLTAKHHDGFALWPDAVSRFNVTLTPARRDLIAPLAAAARAEGLRFGLYYSQAQDWASPGGAKRNPRRNHDDTAPRHLDDGDGWCEEHKGDYDAYLRGIALPQVAELLNRYSPDILWWDTPVHMTFARARPFLDLAARHPRLLMNDRLGGDGTGAAPGDFATPEQYIPPAGLPGRRFEVCMTMNDTWGFSRHDQNWKSTATLLRALSDITGKGGNLLLNIGPQADGAIPPPALDRLREIAAWMRVNSAAIHGTRASPWPRQLPWGRATRRPLPAAGETLYLHIWNWPDDGRLLLPALHQTPRTLAFLAGGTGGARASGGTTAVAADKTYTGIAYDNNPAAPTAQNTPGGLLVNLPPGPAPDQYITVLALEFDAPVRVQMDAFLPPGRQGVFVLAPTDADLYGSTSGVMQIRGSGAAAFIADWFEPRWSLAYRINPPRAQTYRVTAEIATTAPGALRLEAGKKRITAEVPATSAAGAAPDAGEWQTIVLGDIELPAGQTTLRLRPASKTWTPINLRTLTLAPINQ